VQSAMADRKRSSGIGLSRAAILPRRAIVGCTMILLCALMVHPREHHDQDAPEGWRIWGVGGTPPAHFGTLTTMKPPQLKIVVRIVDTRTSSIPLQCPAVVAATCTFSRSTSYM
jgi:hypothetical protein